MTSGTALASHDPPFKPESATIGGLKIRYAIQEKSSAETLLLLSPWPESIYPGDPTGGLSRSAGLAAP
jgi:hypothetical protein